MPADDIFPSRWPPVHPDRIQLYSLATPTGKKAAIALEELGLAYDAHRIDLAAGDQLDRELVRISPNAKIPCIVDPNGPGGRPLALMESGAILLYLADKAGELIPRNAQLRWETIQWLMWQVGGVGPMFGQLAHFTRLAPDTTCDDYALDRYTREATRLLGVLDRRLAGRTYLVADTFTIADIATFPWVAALGALGVTDRVGYGDLEHVDPWLQRCLARDGVQRGLAVCPMA